jgi:hypothetical protein
MAEQLERRAERAPARFDLGYAPAPEGTDHVKVRADNGLLIGGRWVGPPAPPTARSGRACRAPSAPSTCTASPG